MFFTEIYEIYIYFNLNVLCFCFREKSVLYSLPHKHCELIYTSPQPRQYLAAGYAQNLLIIWR